MIVAVLIRLMSCVVLVTGSVAAVQAKDLNGKLGIGLEQSLGGVSGITVRYWPMRDFGILLTGGVDIVTLNKPSETSEDGETDDSGSKASTLATSGAVSLGFVYNFAQSLHANLGIDARLALGFESAQAAKLRDPSRDSGVVQVGIEIPLVAEFFLSDNFTISVATGILVLFVPSAGATLDPQGHGAITEPDAFSIGIGAGSVIATLGVVYYF